MGIAAHLEAAASPTGDDTAGHLAHSEDSVVPQSR